MAPSNIVNGQHTPGRSPGVEPMKKSDSKPELDPLHLNNTAGAKARTPSTITINGEDLSLADVVAVACHGATVEVSSDPRVRDRVATSVEFLKRHLDEGNVVYGINTGYGGSADTRSSELGNMQKALIQHQNSGVLLSTDIRRTADTISEQLAGLKAHSLPRTIVRGSMLARCNSLLRGHSAVRLCVVEAIITLLNKDYIPIIPLRGSISASGDLQPLSYIAAALEGGNDIYVDCCCDNGKDREILPASTAILRAGLSPLVMGPKEGLGLVNGTAVSCAAAVLALHEAQHLLLASQYLTALCTEALGGHTSNYDPFISAARPHPGQREVAETITRALAGSKLAVGARAPPTGLAQDRYALRTAPQWLGPQLEDLTLAARQLEIELNSTTDNPLIEAAASQVHHGGNFQAASVTSAMEKTRTALQMISRLLFSQCSELINPMLNAHLPPNLCFDDPSVSFTFKGVDINMAAYMSELAFLASPVCSHVQSAEMGNQGVNSLALISARYTMEAVEVVSLMVSVGLVVGCQGVDLCVVWREYSARIEEEGRRLFGAYFEGLSTAEVWGEVFDVLTSALKAGKSKDRAERARAAAEATVVPVTQALLRRQQQQSTGIDISVLGTWTDKLADLIVSSIRDTRSRFAAEHLNPNNTSPESNTTLRFLGQGSARLYRFVRHELRVPLHRGLVEHSTYEGCEREGIEIGVEEGKKTIGGRISVVYEALRAGRMRGVLFGEGEGVVVGY